MTDEYRVEVELTTRDAQGRTGVVRREFRPITATDPQDAANELSRGFNSTTLDRLTGVDDEK